MNPERLFWNFWVLGMVGWGMALGFTAATLFGQGEAPNTESTLPVDEAYLASIGL